jgi:acetyltransferase-like isoleucine patch superfamily enzyme
MIHETAIVHTPHDVGEGTKIWHWTHIRKGVKIGKNCMLGQNVYVDADVEIGNGVRIQNNVSVYKKVTIEDDVFLGPSCVLTNDKYPRSFLRDERDPEGKLSPTLIKKGATIGANATIVCGVTIGEDAFIAAGALVVKDVPPYSLVLGAPGRVVGKVDKEGHKCTE